MVSQGVSGFGVLEGGRMSEVKVLLWDLGGVLIPFSHARLWRNFLRLLPLGKSLAFFWRRDALQKRLSEPLDAFEKGLCSFDDLKDAVENELKVRLDREKFRLAWNDIFGLPGETAALARELHEKYPCFVLSNTNVEHLDFVKEKAPELLFMDGWIPSYEVHALKPQKEFFEKALSLIGVRPQEALLIDDRSENISGAASLGLQTILYRGPEDLRTQFKKLSIL